MKTLGYIIVGFTISIFIMGCNQQCENDEYNEEDFEQIIEEEVAKELEEIAIDFEDLEDKMEEIMYESDRSDANETKDVVVVKLQDAKNVDVDLDIGAGKLVLTGGSSELLTGGFIYSKPKWKPEIKYKVKNKQGFLSVEQPSGDDFNINDDDRYIWNLKFNNEIPLHFNIELGAGISEIALSELNLQHFHMVTGVGKATIDLRGKWKESTDIHIDGGIGLTQIYLPEDVGVKLEVLKGLGGIDVKDLIKKKSTVYVNKAFEKSNVVLKLYVKTGIGKIEVK